MQQQQRSGKWKQSPSHPRKEYWRESECRQSAMGSSLYNWTLSPTREAVMSKTLKTQPVPVTVTNCGH